MSSKYLSPGVYPRERDLSTTVPAVSTSTAALVGFSKRGTLSVNLITNRQQFIEEYGLPDSASSYFHYTALAFLEKGSRLYCRRVGGTNVLYSGMNVVESTGTTHRAHATGQTSTVFYDDGEESDSDVLFSVFAKDPGLWGSSIRITITDVQEVYDPTNSGVELDTTEQYTFVINVWYQDSEGNRNKVEAWKVSRKSKIDGYGKQLYLETKINGYSNYIVVADSTQTDTVLPFEDTTDTFLGATALDGGVDGTTATASAISLAWDDFENVDDVDVQILIDGGFPYGMTSSDIAIIQAKIVDIAETRRDCIAILSVPYTESLDVSDTIDYRNSTLNENTSYAALYAPWCRINDSYNDQMIMVPPSGYAAAQYAYTDYVKEVWYPPAGFDRGTLNILGLSYTYTEGERDLLYSAGVNCLQTFRGYGHVVYGQKTLQKKSSALDRVNVRRLLVTVEKAVTLTLRSFLFELNNELTRFTVTALLDEYFSGLSSAGAFQTEAGDNGFMVICDETNNTPQVIDANELHVDIFVKPVRAAEFIQLQLIVTRSGASFTELVGRGALL